MQAGIDWTMMRRFSLLRAVASMLPESCKHDHQDGILRRHHAVEFSPVSMAGRICDCLQQFPAHAWSMDAASNDYVLVCYCGEHDPSVTFKLPCFVPFGGFMNAYIASAPTFCLPELERVVYPIPGAESQFQCPSIRRYLADGSWMDVKHGGYLRLLHGATMLVVGTRTDTRVSLCGAHGLHAVIQVHESGGSAEPSSNHVTEPEKEEQSEAVHGKNVVVCTR